MAEMTTSTVTTKLGTYRITHPADATDDQIRAFTADYLNKYEPEQIHAPNAIVQRPKPESFLQGVGEGVSKVAYNAARAGETVADALGVREPLQRFGEFINPGATHASVNDAQAEFNRNQDARDTQGSEVGKFVGEVGATLPLAALPGGVMTQGAAGGALLTDARTPGGVAWDAAKGALFSKAGDVALRSGAALLHPQMQAGARDLLNEGVELTPGQMLGGTTKRVEDVAATLPLVGRQVAQAQARGQTTLNTAQINRALRPIGQRLPNDLEAGHDAVAFAGDRLRDAYRDVLPRLSGVIDNTFGTRINAIRANADLPAGAAGQPDYGAMLDQAQGELSNAFTRNGPNGTFSGRTLRDTSERLEDLASAWRKSDDPYVRRVGQATEDMRQQLHALARRQNPADAAQLRNIDRGYASLVRTEKAAAGTADGEFTAAGLNSAVRQTDRSARRRAVSRGQALDQDLSSNAVSVMQNNAARGGSKDVNTLIALGALGSRAVTGDPFALAAGAGIGAGSLAYTSPALDIARRVIGRNPQGVVSTITDPLSDLLRAGARGAPILIPAAADTRGN